MRVALVAPPWYPVPPEGYGGIELFVALLGDELVELGHDVTVFGRAGGGGRFEYVALARESASEELGGPEQLEHEFEYLERVYDAVVRAGFEVVHENSGYMGMLLAGQVAGDAAVVATLHGDLDSYDSGFLSVLDGRVRLVAISEAQRSMVEDVDWAGVVHHAVDARALRLEPRAGDYLVDLARITPDKGQHVAIEVARRAGRRLVLAGKVAEGDDEYFERCVKPHLGGDVEWLPNVEGRAKADLLAGAAAMLFPIQWEEPFGLAMAEAMVSGTPVVATPRGAAVELVEEGVTGFLAADVDGLVDAVRRVAEIDRRRCGERARERFSPRRMAREYEAIYRAALIS